MKLEYNELLDYYSKGLLQEMIDKFDMTSTDIMDAVADHVENIDSANVILQEKVDDLENYEDAVDGLNDEIQELKYQVSDLEEEAEDLLGIISGYEL